MHYSCTRMATVGFKGLTTNNFSKPQRNETCELITVRRYEWLVLKLSTATSRERRRHRCVVKLSWRTIQTAGQYYVHNAALIREAQLVWTCEHNLHAVMLNEAKTSRPRPKIIMKKWQIMINNIWLKIIVGKNNEIPEFYTIFARKIPDYIIRQRDRGQAEAKASRPRPRPKWPRVFNITAYTNEYYDLEQDVAYLAQKNPHSINEWARTDSPGLLISYDDDGAACLTCWRMGI